MKGATRLVALLGAAAVGWLLFRAAPRDVTLVYDVGGIASATALEVRIHRGDELIRGAEFLLPAPGGQVRHTVRLRDGRYRLVFRIDASPRPVVGEREVEVSEPATIVLSLAP